MIIDMRRFLIQLLIILICFLLQTAVFRYITFAEIMPNILLIPTMAFGMMRGRREGMVVGFISGLLLDIFYGVMIGPYALLYMYLGYINGFFHRVYYGGPVASYADVRSKRSGIWIDRIFCILSDAKPSGLRFLFSACYNTGNYLYHADNINHIQTISEDKSLAEG